MVVGAWLPVLTLHGRRGGVAILVGGLVLVGSGLNVQVEFIDSLYKKLWQHLRVTF